MIHRLQPSPAGPPQQDRALLVYGRLPGVPAAALSARMVKAGYRRVRAPARADEIALAHEAAARCIGADGALALPFMSPGGAALISENTLRRRLGLPAPAPAAAAVPYGAEDVARLSGLTEAACRTLLLFDVLAPGGGPPTYPDLATARQVAGLLREGIGLAAVVAAAATLGRRGLRVSQVRLAEAPWGELVQRHGAGIARLDGQFALVLDEQAGNASERFRTALEHEESGALEEAERDYGRAEQLDRTDPVIPFNRGNVLAAQGRQPEAMIAFRRALDRDPTFAEAAFNLARLLEASGQPGEALSFYGAAIAAHPGYVQALYNGARLLTALEAYGEATVLWGRFIRLAPDDPDIGHARRLALLCRMKRG